MSFHIELDSIRRDAQTYPNPANYSISGSDVSTWSKTLKNIGVCTSHASLPKSHNHNPAYNSTQNRCCVSTTPPGVCSNGDYFKVTLDGLTLPFPRDDIIDEDMLLDSMSLLSEPRLYVDLHTQSYDDNFLLQTIGGHLSSAKFTVIIDKIQTGLFTSGDPLDPANYTSGSWIHYKALNCQVMRFKPGDPITFTVYDRFGNVIPYFTDSSEPQNDYKQILATFSFYAL